MRTAFTAVLAAAVASIAGSAAAQEIVVSYNYTNLKSSYTSAAGFTARATNLAPDMVTSGFVTRNVAPNGSSLFPAGFAGALGAADFSVNLSVDNLIGNMADGTGTFTAVDLDGDVLSGTIVGNSFDGPLSGWRSFGPFVSFSGLIQSAAFTPAVPGSTTFDGAAGSFDFSTVPGGPVFTGAFVLLFTQSSGGLFTGSFDNIPSEVSAQLVPTPGSAALLAAGGVFLARRRRGHTA